MRITTLFRRLLGVISLFVRGVYVDECGVIAKVKPSWRKPRCSGCGERRPGYDRLRARRWRHLAQGRMPIFFEYAPRRVECPDCGVVVEEVSWGCSKSRFTWDFEELVAYYAQIADKTAVTKLLGIAWPTVGNIVERVVTRHQDEDRLEGLRDIGVDEFSYRKHHNYLTIVVDHQERRVVWAGKGKSRETLQAFFDELGPGRCQRLRNVTMDMAPGYQGAVEENAPQAKIVFDRFHVQQLASKALDEVRREAWREQRGTDQGTSVKKSRWALLKRLFNLNRREKQKLSEIQKNNHQLYRAYLLKETLARALDYKEPWRAERALKEWLSWACRSQLKPFVRLSRTIRQHLPGIIGYLRLRLTNGLVEGINNKIRVVARRAFGFHSADSLMAMVFLCCGGIILDPPLPLP